MHEHSDNKMHVRGHLLRPMLALLFSATVPVGITIGLFTLRVNTVFSGRTSFASGPPHVTLMVIYPAQLKMVQGIMAALSAGLLIYAATVEMLAADFVLAAGPEGLAQAHPGKQALALVSLAAGVAGMSVIGYVTSSIILTTAPLMLLPSGYGLRKHTSHYC
jgi:zinc transporter 1/2/3